MSLSTMFDESIYGKMYGNQRSVASNLPTVSDRQPAQSWNYQHASRL